MISADLLIQPGFLQYMADLHRTKDAACTILLKKPLMDPNSNDQPKKKEGQEPEDIIGLNDENKLLYFSAFADIDETVILQKKYFERFISFITLFFSNSNN